MIEIRGATKNYGSTVVVDGVDLRIEPGGITSIIGANGAGKSTLLGLIARLLTLDAGTVTVNDLDVTKTKADLLARTLSILRQDNSVGVRLTVRELVGFGRYPYSKGRLTGEDRRLIDEAIAYLDLTELGCRYLDELSGGQRQRAFVAMVLCQGTDYVLLDEPLNNLDMKRAAAMMTLLRAAATDLDRTVVLVIHDINFASCYSDRIIGIKDGRVVCQGSVDEVMTTETLREIYDMDIPVREIDGHRLGIYFSAN